MAFDPVFKELSDKLGVWESERFLRILEAMFTPVEAKICMELFEPATCPELAERLRMDEKDLSKKLRVHYNILSRVINEKFHLGYNDFINKYRIDEAKLKLSDPEQKNRTILEILYDCGFNSKSVFNTTFKKFTGKTPSAFRKLMK